MRYSFIPLVSPTWRIKDEVGTVETGNEAFSNM